MNPQVSSVEADAAPGEPGHRGPSLWQIVVMVLVVGAVGGWLARTYWPESHPGRDSVDVGFLNDMSTHHQQAIQMGLTYQQRGSDPVLGQMAREIVVSQAAEVGAMTQILEAWGEHDPPEQSMAWMGHAGPSQGMPGMASPAGARASRPAQRPSARRRVLSLDDRPPRRWARDGRLRRGARLGLGCPSTREGHGAGTAV